MSQIYFDKGLYMFQTDLLSIIRSLNTVYTAIGICYASYGDCLLVRSAHYQTVNIIQHDKYLLLRIRCWDSWWWTVDLSETCRVLYQNKFELVIIIRIYHDARSSECQILWLYEDHVSNQHDATFYALYWYQHSTFFWASLAHRQELRNCVYSLWYWHVDLCNDW